MRRGYVLNYFQYKKDDACYDTIAPLEKNHSSLEELCSSLPYQNLDAIIHRGTSPTTGCAG